MRTRIGSVLLALLLVTGCAGAEQNLRQPQTAQEGTPVLLLMNGKQVHAAIYDTVTGQAFLQLLPYSVSVSRAASDLCGAVSEVLPTDTTEARTEWKSGEIGWFGGLFSILCDHEEQFAQMPGIPIIGKINDGDMAYVTSLTGTVDITVTLEEQRPNGEEANENMLTIRVNDKVLTATLAQNSSAEALKALLAKGDMTIDMRDYAGMEKVGSLGTALPANDEQITTEAGDLILYQGSAFVIYYAPNAWNFTRLGRINDTSAAELKKILGSGNVSVTLSLP